MHHFITTAAFACWTGVANASPSDLLVHRGREGVSALTRAADALGPAGGLLQANSLSFAGNGELIWPHQGPAPGQPFHIKLRHKHFLDWQNGRTTASQDLTSPESSWNNTATISHRDNNDVAVRMLRFSPHAVVREMLARPSDLQLVQSLPVLTIAGRLGPRLVFLDLDPASYRPLRLRLLQNETLHGDSLFTAHYGEYRQSGEWSVPSSIRYEEAGGTGLALALSDYRFNTAAPDWYKPPATPAAAPAQTSPAPGLVLQPLSPGVYLAQAHGGADYHGLVVELDDGLMVLETPAALGNGAELRAALAGLSNKPVRYVVATHHHDDHSGGLWAVGDDRTELLATPGNAAFFQMLRSAPRTFAGATLVRVSPKVRILSDGERIGPVQFFNVGPTRHAVEQLVFYFPEQRLLFQSDMARFAADGTAEAGRDTTCALAAFIAGRNLAVDRIVGGHGGSGTIAGLRQAIAKRERPCPSA